MSIAHELSCDVATAILSERRDEAGASGGDDYLTSIVLEVHTTLRRLTSEARRGSLNRQLFPAQRATPTAGSSSAASGSH